MARMNTEGNCGDRQSSLSRWETPLLGTAETNFGGSIQLATKNAKIAWSSGQNIRAPIGATQGTAVTCEFCASLWQNTWCSRPGREVRPYGAEPLVAEGESVFVSHATTLS